MHADCERLLREAGLTLAIEPLRDLFANEGVHDAWLQSEVVRSVIEQTVAALAVLTRRPRTLH